MSEPSPREALLERCLEFLRHNGFGRFSLREIAAGAGTSHRMLIYHFGSREGLLTEVVNRIEQEQRDALAELDRAAGSGPGGPDALAEISRAFWRRVSDPALAPAERLFFEVYAQALHGAPWTDGFRAAVITAWERPLRELLAGHGVEPGEAARRSRLGLAVTRGLLLDLLLTGERETVDACAEEFARLMVGRPG